LSELTEKLEGGSGTPGHARATLKQLESRWGELEWVDDAETLEFFAMNGVVERWRKVAGRGREALYEMEP
jgi:hypothetical protein